MAAVPVVAVPVPAGVAIAVAVEDLGSIREARMYTGFGEAAAPGVGGIATRWRISWADVPTYRFWPSPTTATQYRKPTGSGGRRTPRLETGDSHGMLLGRVQRQVVDQSLQHEGANRAGGGRHRERDLQFVRGSEGSVVRPIPSPGSFGLAGGQC